MYKTNFAGLTVLEPTDPLSTDDYSFQALDPLIVDRLLKLGARTHRHDAHAALTNPIDAPVVIVNNIGTLPSSTDIGIAYTLVDSDGGETKPSPVTLITTEAPIQSPNAAPNYEVSPVGGHMLAGTYVYALTLTDGNGETPAGASFFVDIDPGTDTNEVTITGLADIVTATPGATGWRLYKSTSVGQLHFLAAGGVSLDDVVDDGLLCADCNTTPPTSNTTKTAQGLAVTIPATVTNGQQEIVGYRVYAAIGGNFGSQSFVEQRNDFGTELDYQQIQVQPGGPPDVSTSIGGASKIDPDTELVGWSWKRPVANVAALPEPADEGDVRFSLDDGVLHLFKGGVWVPFTAPAFNWLPAVANVLALPAAANVEGDVRLAMETRALYWWDGTGWFAITAPQPIIQNSIGVPMAQRPNIRFMNSTVEDDAANNATVVTPQGGGGGGGTGPLALGDLIEWKDGQGNTKVSLKGVTESIQHTSFNDDFLVDSSFGVPNWSTSKFATANGFMTEDVGAELNTEHITTRGSLFWEEAETNAILLLDTNDWQQLGVGIFQAGDTGTKLYINSGDSMAHLAYRKNSGDAWTDIQTWVLAPAPAVGDHLSFDLTIQGGSIFPFLYNQTQDVTYINAVDAGTFPVPATMVGVGGGSGVTARYQGLGSFRFDAVSSNFFTPVYKLYAVTGAAQPVTLATDDGSDQWQTLGTTPADWSACSARLKDGRFEFYGQFMKVTGAAPLADELICTIDTNIFPAVNSSAVVVTGDIDGEELGFVHFDSGTGTVRWRQGRSTDPVTKNPYIIMDGVYFPI